MSAELTANRLLQTLSKACVCWLLMCLTSFEAVLPNRCAMQYLKQYKFLTSSHVESRWQMALSKEVSNQNQLYTGVLRMLTLRFEFWSTLVPDFRSRKLRQGISKRRRPSGNCILYVTAILVNIAWNVVCHANLCKKSKQGVMQMHPSRGSPLNWWKLHTGSA